MKTALYAVITSLGCAAVLVRAEPTRPMATALQPFVDNQIIAGAVTLVATKDKTVSLDTTGYADLAKKTPMAPDTLFWIASMNKPITSTALMMLVDEGKVNVNDPVEKYLPEFKGQMVLTEKDENHAVLKKPAHPILVREILSHTSGLLKRCPMDLPQGDVLPLRELVRTYPLSPLESEPGTAYDYSNPGLNTVGRIVEVVSGMPYEKFLATRIFEPLGMKDTTFFPTKAQLKRLATTYKPQERAPRLVEAKIVPLTYPLDDPKRNVLPAGGLFSTAQDIATFCQMVLSGGVYGGKRYISENSIRMMTSKQTPDSVRQAYGFAWSTGLGKDRQAFGHGGAYRTYMFIDPKVGVAGVFLTQRQGAWVTPEEKKVWPAFTQAMYAMVGVKISSAQADPEGAP